MVRDAGRDRGLLLFLGDAPYGRGPRAGWDDASILVMLHRLYDLGAAWYVEGHRAPQRLADLARRIEWLAGRLTDCER